MNIRRATPDDRLEWARMRTDLWPGDLEEHLHDIDQFLSANPTDIVEAFVIERSPGKLAGFIELNIRNYAEGTSSTRVPYIEGWFIDPDLRGQGHGDALIKTAERWAIEGGFDELASDAELHNTESINAHLALGFEETDRIVCFLKKLT